MRRRLAILVLLAGTVGVSRVRADDVIPIVNPGFEANPVSAGCFAVFTPTGWQAHDPGGILDCCADVVGGIHCGVPYFPGGAPEGAHAGIVFLSGNVGGPEMGLRQTLTSVLQADSTYTLTAQIGDIDSGQGPPPCDVFGFFNLEGFPGYRVQLLAGGEVIAEDVDSLAGTIPEGAFRLSRTRVTIDAGHPRIGQPLEIRLINRNIAGPPAMPGIEVDFDDVRLSRRCSGDGDVNLDGQVDAADVPAFIDVLLGAEGDPVHARRADTDCNGAVDGRDVQGLVGAVLGA